MEIIPIGVYGPYPKAGQATSSYIVKGKSATILLDFGSGALSLAQKMIDLRKIDGIILTHLHYDHFVDTLPLAYYLAGMRKKLYCPASPTECFSLLKNRKEYDIGAISAASRIAVGDMYFEFERMAHPVECYAVRVTEGEKSFVYTGDCSEIGTLDKFCIGAELVLCDCASAPNSPHLTPEGGAELMKLCGATVYMTHINPAYDCTEKAKKLGLKIAQPCKKITV